MNLSYVDVRLVSRNKFARAIGGLRFEQGLILALILISIGSRQLQANSIAHSEIELTALHLTPSAGTFEWGSSFVSLTAFTEALNSFGELDQQFDQQSSGSVHVQSTVANATAQAGGTDLPSGGASATVETFDDSLFSGFAAGRFEFQAEFMITGVSGFVTLDIEALLAGSGFIQNDPSTDSFAPVNFALEIDGNPTLNFSMSAAGGAGASESFSFSESVSGSVEVPAETPLFMSVTVETDPGVTTVPEGGAGWSFAAALALLIGFRQTIFPSSKRELV